MIVKSIHVDVFEQAIVFKKTWYVSAWLGISSRIMQRPWYL